MALVPDVRERQPSLLRASVVEPLVFAVGILLIAVLGGAVLNLAAEREREVVGVDVQVEVLVVLVFRRRGRVNNVSSVVRLLVVGAV